MDKSAARQILFQLIQEIDPVTGEILPDDHVIHELKVHQALVTALDHLSPEDPPEDNPWIRKNGKLHAGCPWTEEDNQELLELAAQGIPMEIIARRMSRRVRGVNNQLTLLRQDEGNAPARRGRPWLPQDDDTLQWMAEEGRNMEEMARELGRSEVAIEYRLKRLGLYEDASE